MDEQMALFAYPEMPVEQQQMTASALLGLAMEEPVLYMPSFTRLAEDIYAGYWLSWFHKNCRYGQSIPLDDDQVSALFGFSKNRWHGIRRKLKKSGYLTVSRQNGQTHYALNETRFSEAHKQIQDAPAAVPVDRLTAAAMLDKGLRMEDVLFYSVVREQQPYLPPEQRGQHRNWFEHQSLQRQLSSLLNAEEQRKAVQALYRTGILEVESIRQLGTIRYRIHYDAVSDLGWQYIHTEAEGVPL